MYVWTRVDRTCTYFQCTFVLAFVHFVRACVHVCVCMYVYVCVRVCMHTVCVRVCTVCDNITLSYRFVSFSYIGQIRIYGM